MTQNLRDTLVGFIIAGLSLMVFLIVGGGAPEPAPVGIADPGAFVGWATPFTKLLMDGVRSAGHRAAARGGVPAADDAAARCRGCRSSAVRLASTLGVRVGGAQRVLLLAQGRRGVRQGHPRPDLPRDHRLPDHHGGARHLVAGARCLDRGRRRPLDALGTRARRDPRHQRGDPRTHRPDRPRRLVRLAQPGHHQPVPAHRRRDASGSAASPRWAGSRCAAASGSTPRSSGTRRWPCGRS